MGLVPEDEELGPSWFDASAFTQPSFDAAAYVDDMSAYVSMDELREALEKYQTHIRKRLTRAVNDDHETFLSLSDDLVDVQARIERDLEEPLERFKRDVRSTRDEVIGTLNDLRDKLKKRREISDSKATLEMMLDAHNVASKVERLLDQLPSSSFSSSSEPRDVDASSETEEGKGWTWKGAARTAAHAVSSANPEEEEEEKEAVEAAAVEDVEAFVSRFESEIALDASALDERQSGDDLLAGLDALRSRIVRSDAPNAAQLAFADDTGVPAAADTGGSTSLRERCRLLERVAGETNRFRSFQSSGNRSRFLESLSKRLETSEARVAQALREALREACSTRDSVSISRCFSAYVSLDRAEEAEATVRETRTEPAARFALAEQSQPPREFPEALHVCLSKVLESVDAESRVVSGDAGKNHGGGLDARVSIAAECVLRVVDALAAKTFPEAFTPGVPEQFHRNHRSACLVIDILEKKHITTHAGLTLFRNSVPVAQFFKRWNLGAYFALRRREIIERFETCLEEDRLTRAVRGPFALAATAGALEALERCFHEDVFLPRATDKFLKLAAQILSRFGRWVETGAGAGAGADGVSPGAPRGNTTQESEAELVVSWGIDVSDDDLLLLRGDVERFAEAVNANVVPKIARRTLETLGEKAAEATRVVLLEGARALCDFDDDPSPETGRGDATPADGSTRGSACATRALDARVASEVVSRCAAALGQLKGITATFRMTNKPMPVKPSHFVNGVLAPLLRFAESDALRNGVSKNAKARVIEVTVSGVCDAYAAAAKDLVVSVKKTEASLRRLKRRDDAAAEGSVSPENQPAGSGEPAPSDSEKIRRQVKLDAEEFGRHVGKIGFDVSRSEAFARLWEIAGEGEPFQP